MARCDFAAWRPITHNYSKGGMFPIRGFVPHTQVGTGSLAEFFDRPATQASAHFWISKSGTIEQYVDSDDRAWAQGAGNAYFISCEFEGGIADPFTPQQIDQGGRLIAWCYRNVGPFPLQVNEHPDGQGVTPHYAGGQAWGNHSCPGPGPRFGQYGELILAALRWLEEPHTATEADDEEVITLADITRKEWDDLVQRVKEIQLSQEKQLNLDPPTNLSGLLVEVRDNARKAASK